MKKQSKQKKITLYHLTIRNLEQDTDHYYSSLTALCEDKKDQIGVSKSRLEKMNWDEEDYENDLVRIRKSFLITGKMIREGIHA